MRRRSRFGARGLMLRQWAVVLGLLGGTGAVGYLTGPRLVEASDSARQERTARRAALDMMLDAVAGTIARSRAVLAVHPRLDTPYVEVVLWMRDERNPGQVDADELVLVSHSRALRSVRMFVLDPGRVTLNSSAALGASTMAPDRPVGGPDTPGFGDHWRSDPRVTSTVLADGVSDLVVETIRSDDGGAGALRIELIWASETADWAERAEVVVRLPPGS